MRYSFFFAISLFLIGVPVYEARAEAIESLLNESGIHGVAQWIQADPASRKAPELRSKEASAMSNKEGFVWSNEFGAILCRDINSLSNVSDDAEDSLRQVDDLVVVRNWIVSGHGYGNLVLSYQTEDAVLDRLFRLLKNTEISNREIEQRLTQMSNVCCDSDSWSDALIEEGVTSSKSAMTSAISVSDKTRNLLQPFLAINDRTHLPGTLSYGDCYENRNLNQLAWKAVFVSEKSHALECCLYLKETTGVLPTDKDAFIQAMKEHASDCLRRENNLSGPITPHQVWRIWNKFHE